MRRRNQSNVKDKYYDIKSGADASESSAKKSGDEVKLKFGPLGLKKEHQIWSRITLFTCILIIVVVIKMRKITEVTWVPHLQQSIIKGQSLVCSEKFSEEIKQFQGCSLKHCGRFVQDTIVSDEEADILLQIFKKGLKFSQSSGGARILDLHTGAISHRDGFINIYNSAAKLWKPEELAVYVNVKNKIRRALADNFKIAEESIHLTSPTFFSEMTERPARTLHDEYWHPHVDKETYETFHFTSLLYLSHFGVDFHGGRFVFVDQDHMNRTIEPRKGRVSMFTSGSENLHYVEKVLSGSRYALTIAFTCDPKSSILDPHIPPVLLE